MLSEIERHELCVYPCLNCPCASSIVQAFQFQDDLVETYRCTFEGNNERILDKVNAYCRRYGTFVKAEFDDRITRLPPYFYYNKFFLMYNPKTFSSKDAE